MKIKKHYDYERDVEIVPESEREFVQKCIDESIRKYQQQWSQPHLCECGRVTRVLLMYQFSGCGYCMDKARGVQ